MATYYDLYDLSGLHIGDVVLYNADSTAKRSFRINFAGVRAKVRLNGINGGGITEFTIDTNELSNKYISYNTAYGVSLMYNKDNNSTVVTDPYYRIAVAGNSGINNQTTSHTYGAGGGLTAPSITYNGNTNTGGSQVAGGQVYNSTLYPGQNGSFGVTGLPSEATNNRYNSIGGAGWYAGATGAQTGTYGFGGTGGSGFIIGNTTTVYPSGYMGDYSPIIDKLVSIITDASVTTGNGIGGTAVVTTDPNTVLYLGNYTVDDFKSNNFVLKTGSSRLDCPMVITIMDTKPEVTSISIKTLSQTNFNINETFNTNGLVVQANYVSEGNSFSEDLSSQSLAVSTPDMTTEGDKTVTITATVDGQTFTTTYTIHVYKYGIGYYKEETSKAINYAIDTTNVANIQGHITYDPNFTYMTVYGKASNWNVDTEEVLNKPFTYYLPYNANKNSNQTYYIGYRIENANTATIHIPDEEDTSISQETIDLLNTVGSSSWPHYIAVNPTGSDGRLVIPFSFEFEASNENLSITFSWDAKEIIKKDDIQSWAYISPQEITSVYITDNNNSDYGTASYYSGTYQSYNFNTVRNVPSGTKGVARVIFTPSVAGWYGIKFIWDGSDADDVLFDFSGTNYDGTNVLIASEQNNVSTTAKKLSSENYYQFYMPEANVSGTVSLYFNYDSSTGNKVWIDPSVELIKLGTPYPFSSGFNACEVNYYDGTAFQKCAVYRYNGSSWEDMIIPDLNS